MLSIGAILVSVITSLFGFGAKVVDASVITTVAGLKYGTSVITSAMGHWVYWLAWGLAAVPLATWFGWGMLDTLANGALPDVAVIPPGLKDYADIAWGNIFWAGLGGYGVSRAATVLERIFAR